jgi:hypothetical protein
LRVELVGWYVGNTDCLLRLMRRQARSARCQTSGGCLPKVAAGTLPRFNLLQQFAGTADGAVANADGPFPPILITLSH